MIILSVITFYSRKIIVNFRTCLELYQIFLSKFEETPRTKVVKKYLVDDPILEDEEESRSSLISGYARKNTTKKNRKVSMINEILNKSRNDS